ncbi:hypothetical protein Pd630_LPD07485 [Rhodococcus opacus PD630]|nr:hypothetical protein Pd630_LPD07485 [Rhodococcus opacus PD630]
MHSSHVLSSSRVTEDCMSFGSPHIWHRGTRDDESMAGSSNWFLRGSAHTY